MQHISTPCSEDKGHGWAEQFQKKWILTEFHRRTRLRIAFSEHGNLVSHDFIPFDLIRRQWRSYCLCSEK